MKEIYELESQIREELNDAEKYVDCALAKKDTYPSLSALYLKLSIEEIGHANSLHTEVEKMIEAYRREHGEPSERMLGRYEYAHQIYIEQANRIKAKQGIFKESK